jgi:hypothetical protein
MLACALTVMRTSTSASNHMRCSSWEEGAEGGGAAPLPGGGVEVTAVKVTRIDCSLKFVREASSGYGAAC